MAITTLPSIEQFRTVVFDFDGVFTNNKVYFNAEGEEFVQCDRRDGMGLLILKNYLEKKSIDLKIMILSKEKNEVVKARANKLGIECLHGVDDKYASMKTYFENQSIDIETGFKTLAYLGNDLNDLEVMMHAGLSVAPHDAHPLILKNAHCVSERDGGDEFIRDFIEKRIELPSIEQNLLLDILSHR